MNTNICMLLIQNTRSSGDVTDDAQTLKQILQRPTLFKNQIRVLLLFIPSSIDVIVDQHQYRILCVCMFICIHLYSPLIHMNIVWHIKR